MDGQDEPVGAAEVVVPPGGGLAALCLGYTQATGDPVGPGVSDAEGPAVEGRYEPRFLEIPGLGATAVWLRNLEGNQDRIIPVDPVPRFLRMKGRVYPIGISRLLSPAGRLQASPVQRRSFVQG